MVEGTAHLERQELAEALRSFDSALEIDPLSLPALEGRGRTLVELHRLDEALVAFDRVLELAPEVGGAHFNRAGVLAALSLERSPDEEQRLLEEALAEYERSVELQPDHPESHCRVGFLRYALARPGAVASFDRAIALSPDHAEAHFRRGMALFSASPEEALASFERVLRIEPENPHATYWRALALHRLERLEEAADALDRALSLGAAELYPGIALDVREGIRQELRQRGAGGQR